MELKFPKNAVGLDVIVVLNPLLNKSELDLDKAIPFVHSCFIFFVF